MARYACLKVRRVHVVKHKIKTGVKRQWNKRELEL